MQHFESDKNLKSIFTAIKNFSQLKITPEQSTDSELPKKTRGVTLSTREFSAVVLFPQVCQTRIITF